MNNFFLSKNKGVSQFWQGLHQVKHLFQWGAMNKIKNGEGTLFWKDIWMGKVPIKIKYPRFFDICRDKDVPVSECCERGECNIDLVRPLNDSDCCLWEELHTELREHNTSQGRDLVFWALDNSHRFTTKSLYRFRTDGGVKTSVYKKKLELQGAFEDQGFSMANLQWENPSDRSARKKGGRVVCCALCVGTKRQLITSLFIVSFRNMFGED
jgi:hypothetical protein